VAGRVKDARHVVVEKPAGLRRHPGAGAGPVLQPGERAGQVRGDDQDQPGRGGDLRPEQPGPAPRGKAAEHAEGQKREVRGDHGVRDGFEEHDFTVRRGATSGRVGDTAPHRYGVLNPRVYEPLPEEATTTYR
jgi:hypothetical protein